MIPARPPRTFRSTLLRLLILPVGLMTVFLGVGTWVVVYQTRVLGEGLNTRVAQGLGAQVADQLDLRREVLDQWVQVLEVTPVTLRSEVFRRLSSGNPWFEGTYLLDPGLMVRESWPDAKGPVGTDFSGQEVLQRLGPSGGVGWSESSLSLRTGRPTASVARNFPGGVLLANLDLEPLARLVARLSEGTDTSVALVDAHGTYLAHPDPEVVRLRQPNLTFLTRREASGPGLRSYRETQGGEQLLVSVQPLEDSGWSVLVTQAQSSLDQPLVPIFFVLVALTLLMGLGAFLMVWILDRHLLGALTTLRRRTEELGRGEFGGGEVLTRYDDLNAILKAFDDMRQGIWLREQDLRLGERRYRRMFEDAAIGIFHTTYSGTLLDLNQSLATLLGYFDVAEVKQELGGSSVGFYVRPEEREALLKMLQDSPDAKVRVTTELFHRGGGTLTVNHHLARVFDPLTGEFILEAFVEDVTELKKAEQAVRDLNRGLEAKVLERTAHLEKALQDLEVTQAHLVQSEKNAILLNLHTGVAHDLNTPLGAIRASNETQMLLLHRVLDELPPLLTELNPDQFALMRRFYESAARNLEVVPSATQRRRRREIQAVLTERSLPGDEQTIDSLVDLGLSPKLDEWWDLLALPQAGRIVGLTDAMVGLEKAGLIIGAALEKASAAINELRIASTETRESTFERIELKPNLETVLTLFQHRFRSGVTVKTSLDPKALVWGLPDQLNQVWTNLVANALQAMEDHGTLDVSLAVRGGRVLVTVIDNGPGVPPQIGDRIFERHFTTRSQSGGTGLGLDICRRVVGEHHGTLSYDSRPGHTEFRVELPLAAEAPG